MKKRILFSSLLFCLLTAATEGNSQQSVNASGGNGTGPRGSISYSVGQVVYAPMRSPKYSLTPGVQQSSFTIYQTVESDNVEISVDASVFPNPTASAIFLYVANHSMEYLSAQLLSTQGSQLQKLTVSSNETRIEMGSYAPGTYILHVYDRKSLISSFKIIKN